MTKRFCDRCGKEVGVFKDIEFQTWWTITRHGMMDLTTELCDDCYQAKFTADTPQTDCDKCIWSVCNYNKVDWDADTPQTERIKTTDYCDICNHKGCDNCIANNLDDYCVPSGYAPKDTPQTDCGWGRP